MSRAALRSRAFALAALVVLTGLMCAPALAEPASATIRFAEVTSKALGRTLPLAIVEPMPAEPRERPVLFILHGRGRNHRSLIEAAETKSALLSTKFFIVLPQGEDGWYVDSPARPEDRYAAYLEEVVAWADQTLPISRVPARRGIAGWSMGGYGAVRFAETHRGAFGFVASIIGLLDFPRPETLTDGQNYPVPTPRFTTDPETWRRFNPLYAIDRLDNVAVTLVLATRGFERTMNETFVAALAQRGRQPTIHWLEGGHEFSVVARAIPVVLQDAAEFFQRPIP